MTFADSDESSVTIGDDLTVDLTGALWVVAGVERCPAQPLATATAKITGKNLVNFIRTVKRVGPLRSIQDSVMMVSLCSYAGAQQHSRRNSVVPVFQSLCAIPGGIAIASPGFTSLVSVPILILPVPLVI